MVVGNVPPEIARILLMLESQAILFLASGSIPFPGTSSPSSSDLPINKRHPDQRLTIAVYSHHNTSCNLLQYANFRLPAAQS